MAGASRRGRGRLVRTLYWCACVFSALSFAGMAVAPLAPFSHFQVFLAGGWTFALLLWLASARLRGAFWKPRAARRVAQTLLLAHGAAVAWLWLPSDQPAFEQGSTVELVFMNLRAREQPWQDLQAAIAARPPDLLALVEAKHALLAPPEGYPHVLRSQQGGLVLYSRLPMAHTEVHAHERGRDVLEADLLLRRGRLHLILAHPHNHATRSHDEELRRLAGFAEAAAYTPTPLVLVGDLNTTRWSQQMRHLLRFSGMRAACCDGRGPHVTWSPFASPLGLAIDHLLAGPTVAVETLEWLPWMTGADHRGLRATLRVDPRVREDPLGD